MRKKSILDISFGELQSYLASAGEEPFRARQIFSWIYEKTVIAFAEMKNLSQGLRQRLDKDFYFPVVESAEVVLSRDGARKYVFQLEDRQTVETVFIPTVKRATVCVSSQAGCKFGCRFCASGIGGWVRDLSCGEILMQILHIQKQEKRKITHVVFMGTGEPLDNWPNVRSAIEHINAEQGLCIAARRITVSTCGLIPRLKDMEQFDRQIELAVSLHGYNDRIRSQLMPVNKTYPLAQLIAACHEYARVTHRQITFEYVLIEGLTLTKEGPEALGRLLRGLTCKVNLIPYNPVDEFQWNAPSRNAVYRFRDELVRQGVHATIRWSKGQGTQGACGQLRRVKSEE